MSKHTMQGRVEYNQADDRADVAVTITFDTETQRVDSGDLNPSWFEGRFPVLYLGESVESDSSAVALTPGLLIALIDDIRTALREAGWEIL